MNYGEWETINGVKRGKGGLHNMNTVEGLLKEGKIRVGFKDEGLGKWIEVEYEEFINMDTSKNKIAITSDLKTNKGPKNWGNPKSLFPKNRDRGRYS